MAVRNSHTTGAVLIIILLVLSSSQIFWKDSNDHLIGVTRRSYNSENGTATSGSLFSGIKYRHFSKSDDREEHHSFAEFNAFLNLHSPQKKSGCKNWAVVTTIFKISTSVIETVKFLKGWCMIVVGDEGGPEEYDVPNLIGENGGALVFYLRADLQRELGKISSLVKHLPWKHFGRKNVGYLWAILHGAEAVWDFDDDNQLVVDHLPIPAALVKTVVPSKLETSVYNPYPGLGASIQNSWPRGFPLENIKDMATTVKFSDKNMREIDGATIGVIQSLANDDPDVDAIYRLTQPLPLTFSEAVDGQLLALPSGTFCPYNAQATLHLKSALWSLLLPVTVHGRVSDIWRGYFMQRLLWDVDVHLAFTGPLVKQSRNPHSWLGDLQAEQPLYMKSGKLVQFLSEWESLKPTLDQRAEELYIALYERGYIEIDDVHLLQLWLKELASGGYVFPRVTSKRSWKPEHRKVRNEITTPPSAALLQKDSTPAPPPPSPPSPAESSKSATDFAGVLLIVNFNTPYYNLIDEYLDIHSKYFTDIVFCGPALPAPGHRFKFVWANTTAHNTVGFAGYQCYVEAYRQYPDYSGYLYTNDDVYLNAGNLMELNRTALWTSHCQGVPLPSPQPQGWWWPHSWQALLSVWGNMTVQEHHHLREPNGVEHIYHGFSDVFYVPRSAALAAANLLDSFHKTGPVFLEIAVPTSLKIVERANRMDVIVLDPPGTKAYLIGDSLRHNWVQLMKQATYYLHPIKLRAAGAGKIWKDHLDSTMQKVT